MHVNRSMRMARMGNNRSRATRDSNIIRWTWMAVETHDYEKMNHHGELEPDPFVFDQNTDIQ